MQAVYQARINEQMKQFTRVSLYVVHAEQSKPALEPMLPKLGHYWSMRLLGFDFLADERVDVFEVARFCDRVVVAAVG
jgi:hypothetical protein